MNRVYYILFILTFATIACRGDGTEGAQKIDQQINIYIKNSAGKDLLNSKDSTNYQSVEMLDLGGVRDQISISSFTQKYDKDSVNYLEYFAGAVRNLSDSINPNQKKYRSDILLRLNKKNTTPETDTLTIFYDWSPELFQVSRINANGNTIFQKVAGQENKVTIVKP